MSRTSGFSKDVSGERTSSGQLANVTYNSAYYNSLSPEQQAQVLITQANTGQISQTQFREMTGQTPQQLQNQIKTLNEGGYFYNPITKQSVSSMKDLTKEGYVRLGYSTGQAPTQLQLKTLQSNEAIARQQATTNLVPTYNFGNTQQVSQQNQELTKFGQFVETKYYQPLENIYQKSQTKISGYEELSPFGKQIISGLIAIPHGLLISFPRSIAYLPSTLKGVGYSFIHPIETGKSLWSDLKTKPGEFLGEQIGYSIPIGLALGKIIPKAKGYIKTIGREELATESLVPKDVLAGKTRFPEAPPSIHYNLFMKGEFKLPETIKPMGYHATAEKLSLPKIQAGSSEFSGLYISYGVSPHFLRISGETKFNLFGTDLFSKSPTVLAITPSRFIKGTSAKLGEAFIPGVKIEVEAIIPEKTILISKQQKYYFNWEGQRVSINEFITQEDFLKQFPKGINNNIGKTFGQLSYEYTLPSKKISLIKPESLIISSYMSSTKKIYRSIIPSSTISKSIPLSYGFGSSYISKPISKSGFSLIKSSIIPSNIIPQSKKYLISSSSSFSKLLYSPNNLPNIFKFNVGANQIVKIRKIPVKKVIKYTPSFRALIFNIRGARPTGIETGIRVRPITKGFSWSNLFKKGGY